MPAQLPEIEGMDEQADDAQGLRPRIWLWTLIAALIVVLLVVYVLVLGGKGIYDGLRDQALENQQFAQEHYERGLAQFEDRQYELAIAEFELALRHDSSLVDARNRLQEAKDMVQAQGTPTSETRQDAARILYLQAATLYEDGNLPQSVSVLDELRGLTQIISARMWKLCCPQPTISSGRTPLLKTVSTMPSVTLRPFSSLNPATRMPRTNSTWQTSMQQR